MTRPTPDEVPVPAELAGMPRDGSGRVVGWAVGRDPETGEPMQGTNDGRRCAEAILGRRCGLCGGPLGYWVAFIGDPVCVKSRQFLEPPMHEPCARYALAVCPYLASPAFESKRARAGVVQVADRARPERMALYVCRGFEPKWDSDAPMAKARPPFRVEWF